MRRGVCAWVAMAALFTGVVRGGGGFVLDGISQREAGTASQAYVDTARTGVTGQLRGELGSSGRVWRTEWQVAAGASAAVVRAEWRAQQDRIMQWDTKAWLQVADGMSTLWRAERAAGSGRIEVLAVGDEPGVYNGPPVGTIFSNRVDYAQSIQWRSGQDWEIWYDAEDTIARWKLYHVAGDDWHSWNVYSLAGMVLPATVAGDTGSGWLTIDWVLGTNGYPMARLADLPDMGLYYPWSNPAGYMTADSVSDMVWGQIEERHVLVEDPHGDRAYADGVAVSAAEASANGVRTALGASGEVWRAEWQQAAHGGGLTNIYGWIPADYLYKCPLETLSNANGESCFTKHDRTKVEYGGPISCPTPDAFTSNVVFRWYTYHTLPGTYAMACRWRENGLNAWVCGTSGLFTASTALTNLSTATLTTRVAAGANRLLEMEYWMVPTNVVGGGSAGGFGYVKGMGIGFEVRK